MVGYQPTFFKKQNENPDRIQHVQKWWSKMMIPLIPISSHDLTPSWRAEISQALKSQALHHTGAWGFHNVSPTTPSTFCHWHAAISTLLHMFMCMEYGEKHSSVIFHLIDRISILIVIAVSGCFLGFPVLVGCKRSANNIATCYVFYRISIF